MGTVKGAVLSSSFDVLFDNTSDVDKFARKHHFQTELENLRKLLVCICEVLNDAERKQLTEHSVRLWLVEAKHLIYDAENILEELATQSLGRKLKGGSQSTTSKVLSLIPTFCTSLEIRRRLKQITTRLEVISAQKDDLGLEHVAAETISYPGLSTSFFETYILGREDDKNNIVKFLLSNQESESNVDVISIVGMCGLGKTKLAQLVYNDEIVQEHFDLRAWVSVYAEFDEARITRAILCSVTSTNKDLADLEVLVKLRDALAGKMFLLVLDGVWKDDPRTWDLLLSHFAAGAKGSKIIVTTRNRSVAWMMRTVLIYDLRLLPQDQSWQLFSLYAFRNIHESQHLDAIFRILEKCQGLPVALVACGILYHNQGVIEWEGVPHSDMVLLSKLNVDLL